MYTTKNLKEIIENGKLDTKLEEIYVDSALLDYQKKRYKEAVTEFESLFGEGEAEIYSAPGRSEVGGNHTDHQRGCVLAASVNLDAVAVVRKTEDGIVRLKSEGYPMLTVDLSRLEPTQKEEGTSTGLIRGMAAGLKKNGYEIGGFCAYVVSDVPGGSGLSSSAAFEVLVGTVFSGLYNEMRVDPVLVAQIAQYAENVYFGKPCGLMDQMACSVGSLIYIDFKDKEHPYIEQAKVDFSKYHHSLCITDTKGSHAGLTDEYAAVPKEMKAVASYFGKEVLREVEPMEFYKNIAVLREKYQDRAVLRSMHFFGENVRSRCELDALNEGNFEEFLRLIKESGNSSYKYLQNVYSNKNVQKQEVAVGLAVSETVLAGEGASRVHGGGFAGTIQAFVEHDKVPAYKEALDGVFGEDACRVLKIRPVGGVKMI